MPSIAKYISRVLHQLTVGVLIGSSVMVFLGKGDFDGREGKMLLHGCGTIALLTGLFNAHAAEPKRMGKHAGLYRMMIYGIKIPCWLLLLLAEKVPVAMPASTIRAGLVVGLVGVSSFAKFFREDHQAPVNK